MTKPTAFELRNISRVALWLDQNAAAAARAPEMLALLKECADLMDSEVEDWSAEKQLLLVRRVRMLIRRVEENR